MAFAEDLSTFFDVDDFADECVITGADDFEVTLNVILNTGTEQVGLYETNVEAPTPNFACATSDLVGVKRGMTATVRSKAYKVERLRQVEDGATSVVELSS